MLCAALRRQSSSALAGITAGYFEAVRIQAQDAWLASPHARALQADREVAAALVQQAPRFAQEWRARLEAGFDDWLNPSPAQAAGGQVLSLVSESQLQLQLAVQALAGALEAELERVLEPLDARLSQLALAASGARRSDAPLRPLAIGLTFMSGFQGEELNPSLQALLLREFGRRLLPALASLYPELDRQLAQAGYAAKRIGEAQAAGGAASVQTPAQHAVSSSEGWVPDGGVVERRAPALASAIGPKPSLPDAPSKSGAPGQASQAGASAQRPASASHAAAATGASATPAMPAAAQPGAVEGAPMRYRDIVHDHLRHWRESNVQPAANDAAAGESALGSQALYTVASLLQGDDTSTFAQLMVREGGRPLSAAIRDAVASGARQLGLAGGALQFAPDQEDAIDLVAMLFEALMHTRTGAAADSAGAVPRLYAQLVMPYLKIALLDDSLFNRRAHPARQLLDAITEVCDDSAAESEGVALAEGVVDRIVSGYREDLAIFDLAVDELRQFQQQQRRRSELTERRAAEALHGRERLLHARAATRAQLLAWSRRHAETTQAVAGFLQGPWRHAHEQACLRQADEPAHVEQLEQLGEALLRLDADAQGADGPAVADAWLGMADAVDTCCRRAGMDDAMRRDLVAGLVFALAHPETGRDARALAPDADAFNDLEADELPVLRLAGGTDTIHHDPALAARMRRLRPGQALRVSDEHGHDTAARVAWISPLTARLLIVNRRGQRLLVASPEELAALMATGRIALSAAEAPFDRAMKRLWQQLNAASGQHAAAG